MTSPIQHSLKQLLMLHMFCGALLSFVVAAFGGIQLGASFAIGSALMMVSFSSLAWTSWRTLAKKSIAWTVMIIVIKYAVLLGSVVILARTGWFNSLGAGLGIASFVIAVLALAVLQEKKEIT